MLLKPVTVKKQYDNAISSMIIVWFWANIFKGCFDILKSDRVENAQSVLLDEITSGNIFYQGEYFYPLKKRFSNATAKELEKLGAQYSKVKNAYYLPKEKLPTELIWAIGTTKAKITSKVLALRTFLENQLAELPRLQKRLLFKEVVNKMMLDVQERVYKNAQAQKIEFITPKLDDFTASEIAKNYTENLDFWIKEFTEKEIKKLRAVVGQMSIDGKSIKTITDYIAKEFNISQKKAVFLARNENAMATTSYLVAKYKAEGFTKFKWITRMDGRERPLHADLNNQIFRFNDPPIIDERTGQRGLPSQTYNCYSKDTEILTKDGFKPLKDVEIGETVASVNPDTRAFEWTVCTNKVKQFVKDICNIKTNIFELSVSENHTFFYYKKRYDGKCTIANSDYPVFTTGIHTLAKKNTSFLATSYNWIGQEQETICGLPVDIFCKFMGYYLSDGNVDKRSKTCIHISQQNNDEMFAELKPYMHICQGKGKLYIYNKELYSLVAPLGYTVKKSIPNEIKELPSEKIRIFLTAFASCDGKKGKRVKAYNNKQELNTYNQYFTTSPKMMSDLVECIYKTGMSASVYTIRNKGREVQFKNGLYTLNYDLFVIQEMITKTRSITNATIIKEPYDDFVFDIEVKDNHTLLIKKGKSIHWNSNCRCSMSPIADGEWLANRRKLYRANNSIWKYLKDLTCLKNKTETI